MKLSGQHIRELFAFVQKKQVRYYDVQVELVDHLASGIEDLMKKDSSLSFEMALQKMYSSFGIFGFSKLVQQKENEVRRLSNRLFWKEVKTLFKWPQILGVAFVGALSWQLTQTVKLEILVPVFLVIWLIAIVYKGIVFYKRKKRQKKNLLSYHLYTPIQVSDIWLVWHCFFFDVIKSGPVLCIFTILIVITWIASFRLQTKNRQYVESLYPEAFA